MGALVGVGGGRAWWWWWCWWQALWCARAGAGAGAGAGAAVVGVAVAGGTDCSGRPRCWEGASSGRKLSPQVKRSTVSTVDTTAGQAAWRGELANRVLLSCWGRQADRQTGRQADRQTDRQIGRQAVGWTVRDTAAGRCTLQQRAMLRGSEGATCSHLSSLGELGAASPGAIGPPSCHLDSCPPPSSIPPPCRCSLFALALVLALALGLLCRPPARPSTANNVVALCCQ